MENKIYIYQEKKEWYEVSSYFQTEEIAHESLCVNTPQQNEITERKKWSSAEGNLCSLS